MFQQLSGVADVSFLLVFFEGILSFFSPCVIPLIPIYVSYLAGNTKDTNEDGSIRYNRKKMLIHTIFFVLGISAAFFILGLSFTALGNFFSSSKGLFSRISGMLIIAMGLIQIGFLEFKFLKRDHRFNVKKKFKDMNPFMAFIMGFTFSFAWTPCVGPALASVLMLASSAQSAATGNLLVVVYSMGFVIPFLLLGLFTSQVLNFINRNKKLMKYTIKIGGVILIIVGVMTFTGWANSVSGYLNPYANNSVSREESSSEKSEKVEEESKSNEQGKTMQAYDFELTDQYGNKHKLSDYKGKVVFLNFWATWCPPCRMEMPHIEELYNEYNKNNDEVVFLGVANPGGQEKSVSGIKKFLEDEGHTFPTVFDESGELFGKYQVSSLPTTYMIDKEGNIYGYVSGALTKDIMKNIINQTLESTK